MHSSPKQFDHPPLAGEKHLSDVARQALEEAKARRTVQTLTFPPEIGGRGGLDPVRYGDWEEKGLTRDF